MPYFLFNSTLIAALLPLLLAAIVTARVGIKGGDAKMKPAYKAALYLTVAIAWACWLLPQLGSVGTFFGTLLSFILAVISILCITQPFHKPGKRLRMRIHNKLWTLHWKTPIWSRTGKIANIRWARRIAWILFMLFVLFAAIFMGGEPTEQGQASANSGGPAITSLGADEPTPEPSSEPVPSKAPESDKPVAISKPCAGFKPKPVTEKSIELAGVKDFWFCQQGQWRTWNEMFPGQSPPALMTLKAFVADEQKTAGYADVVVNGKPYFVKSLEFK